ncbi:MAG TPA: murein biosynthesis integral membrane protein MurJ [Pseudonocardiaceae bacterium]
MRDQRVDAAGREPGEPNRRPGPPFGAGPADVTQPLRPVRGATAVPRGRPVGVPNGVPETATEVTQPIALEETTRLRPVGQEDPVPAEQDTEQEQKTAERGPSLARASGSMAIATLVSRVTGFLSKVAIAAALGVGVVNDSYTIANTLPNIVYELLLGGVLTSVVVPVLVRAQKDDPDNGEAYTQRLLTLATVVLVVATALAVLAAPLLTRLYLDDSPGSQANADLATAFAYLLLPEIVFYGIGALLQAILNTQGVFGLPAWAPVLNNVVVLVTVGVYALLPGDITLDPVRMTDAHLLVLGVGTTMGIVVQALVMLPALRRTGFRWRWRWGWDRRLSEFGGLALWVIGYVGISQVGYIVITRVASGADAGSVTAYSLAWLLLQMPYGILGVSLLTAIMPRMSRAAADGDIPGVVSDLSLGSRLSAVMLVPISGLLTVLGPELAVLMFSYGNSDIAQAERLGRTLAASAFGLLPYAVVMLQLRVFYAMKDSRTPTLIMVLITAVKVPLSLACPQVLPPEQVVLGLAFVNSFGFVVGAVVGEVWLRTRLGRLQTGRVLRTVLISIVGTVVGSLAAYGITMLGERLLPSGGLTQAVVTLLVAGPVGLVVAYGALMLLRAEELRPALQRLSGLVRRR